MKAELLLQERHEVGDHAFAELRVWRVPEPVRGSTHEYKYSLAYVVNEVCVFRYDNEAVGALYYSREIPSLLRGLRLSKIYGREGIITFESNGAFVLVRGKGWPTLVFPGFRDIRGYRAMYRDFLRAIGDGGAPEPG